MWLAISGRFRARWSATIHDEWSRNLLTDRPDLRREQLDATIEMMNAAVPDALVMGFEPIVEGLALPDPSDRHVLAAAIRCGAAVIVTFNVKDFPAPILEPYGIEAQHPDEFVEYLFDLDPAAVATAAQRQRANLQHPPIDVDKFLDTLLRQGLVQSTKSLAAYRAIL